MSTRGTRKPTGRPSSYKPEYAEQARKLCLIFSPTDEEIAWFFGVELGDLAWWAWENEDFFNAITPSREERAKYEEMRSLRAEKINAAKRRRRHRNPSERIRNSVSARLWAALRGRSDGRLFSRLGYTADELVKHLESRFEPGMSWENYGKWHVDHVRPCSAFDLTDATQFATCWALENLQPLWATDNMQKGAKV